MDFLIIFAIQIALMFVGYLITILIGIKNKIESLGLSYLLGSGLITILFLTNHFLFKISLGSLNFLLSVGLSAILLTALIFYLKKQKEIFSLNFLLIKTKLSKLNCFEKFILSFLISIFSYTLLENYVWPITDWDSLALYDFRARVMSINGNMIEGIELGYFFQYPPYTSFLHLFGYIFGVERVRVVYSFIYLSLITVFYSLLRRNQKRWIALLGALMLSVDTFIFRHATMSYTNLAYVVFLSLGLVYLSFWLLTINKRELFIGSILIALSTWVRARDPFWYIGLIIIITSLIKNKKYIKESILSFFLLIGMYKYWDIFVASLNGLGTKSSIRESRYIEVLFSTNNIYLSILNTAPAVVLYYWDNIFNVVGYLLPLLFFTVYYDFKNKNYLNKYLYSILFLSLLLILIGIMIFSLYFDTWNQIGDSLQRLSMVLTPVIIFIIFNSSIWKKNVLKDY